ncbi:DUF4358 domain-containing protein [Paenibacillus sp. MMS20-IR301]|uniref:DUF4358 domain-containing protein n=1 Tax=Paenibacillus sp. MMS20-IR301 TaxID=2895946 RepID=UPI0028EDF109|nr:DUF4358 domain-containing protein [Paenibacillus sp. MMS20-IR301]WNS43090.1 DUF4358 domain-containing protein [Paenibacillus sp. MMS20-IR301]
MRQKCISRLVLVFILGLLSACTANPGKDEARTVAEIKDSIEQTVDLSGMQLQNDAKLRKLYGIEADDIEGFVLYTADSNVKADELVIIKVKQASETETVMEQIEERIKAQTVKFKDYRPEEYCLIEKHVLKSKGRFVFFAVSKNVERMEEAYDAIW